MHSLVIVLATTYGSPTRLKWNSAHLLSATPPRPALPVDPSNLVHGVLARRVGNGLTLTQLPIRRIGVVVSVLPQHLPVPSNVLEEVLDRDSDALPGRVCEIFGIAVTKPCHSCHARSMFERHIFCSCLCIKTYSSCADPWARVVIKLQRSCRHRARVRVPESHRSKTLMGTTSYTTARMRNQNDSWLTITLNGCCNSLFDFLRNYEIEILVTRAPAHQG